MEASFLQRHPLFRDALSAIIFIVCIIVGTLLINTYIFRSFNVDGGSMETTLYTGDRLIVNRLPVTWAQIQNKDYIPERGQVIVFSNPRYSVGMGDQFIVKRVIAFPGERVLLKNGRFTVFNERYPAGFDPDEGFHGEPGAITSGEVDTIVPKGELFVSGDHREGSHSYDSRNGLGTIPFYDVVGPVGVRIFPFTAMRFF